MFKNLLYFTFLICSTHSFADFPFLKTQNMNLIYNNNQGEVSASYLQYQNQGEYRTITALEGELQIRDNVLYIIHEDTEIALPSITNVLTDIENLKIQKIGLHSEKEQMNLQSETFELSQPDKNIFIKNLKFLCNQESNNRGQDFLIQFFEACVAKSSELKIETFSSTIKTDELNLLGEKAKKTTYQNVLFKFHKQNFTIDFFTFVIFRVSGKIIGTTSLDIENGTLNIRIESAKVGGLNILDEIFSKLKESERVKIVKPNIYIKI